MEKVQQSLKSPCRFTFDAAAEHIYALLLKKDCYPRFVRSEHYKALLATGIQPSHKKSFFRFGVGPKKKSSTAPPAPALLTQVIVECFCSFLQLNSIVFYLLGMLVIWWFEYGTVAWKSCTS